MAFDRRKFIGRFVEEVRDHIEQLNHGFLALEKDPRNEEVLNAVYRSAHSIKGASRMMRLNAVTAVAHKLEDALDAVKKDKIVLARERFDLFFETLDAITAMIEAVAGETEIPESMWTPIRDRLEQTLSEPGPASDIPESPSVAAVSPAASAETQPAAAPARSPNQDEHRPTGITGAVRVSGEKLDELINLMGEIVSSHARLKDRTESLRALQLQADTIIERIDLVERGGVLLREQDREQDRDMFGTVRRLHAGLKDFLADMRDDANVHKKLCEDLQDFSIRMRMMPLSVKFNHLHRIVRDIERQSSKEIDLEITGGETELDGKIIDKIGDPLIHMIRNAIDHGIETPGERLQKGKPAKGTIRISAGYDGGSILIDIGDDGRGIPVEKIKEKAIRKNIVSQADLDKMSRSEIIHLIFRPGFSTTDLVTDVSGRGVGMDVVKRNICDELKGDIRVDTRENEGATFHIRLPLTMAIVRIMRIRVREMSFAIPSRFISEIIRVSPTDIIDVVNKKAFMLREQIIPIVPLGVCLEIPAGTPFSSGDNLLVMVLSAGDDRLGVVVDDIVNEEDAIIKTLPPHMRKNRWVSGVFVTGRNAIVNVLHVPRLFEAARATGAVHPAERAADEKPIRILVVDDSVSTREIEKSILESYGYRVGLAADGIEALECAHKQQYDIVITDIEMPRLDGFSLTRRLRRTPEYRDTPVILVSSRDMEADKRRGLEAGANAYIVKGAFDQSNLLDVIENLVG